MGISNDIKIGKEDACLYLKCKDTYFLQKRNIRILLKCIGTVLQVKPLTIQKVSKNWNQSLFPDYGIKPQINQGRELEEFENVYTFL